MATKKHNILIDIRAQQKGAVAGLRRVEGSIRGLTAPLRALGAVAVAVGAVQIGRELVEGIKKSIEAAAAQEDAEAKLAQAIRNTGQRVQDVLPGLKARASALQDLTGVGDELILSNQAMLVSLGKLSGEGLDRATRAAIDLAAATGQDVSSAFDLVAKAAAGYTSTLSRYGIIIDQTLPNSEKFAAALAKIEENFGGQAQAQLDTYTGRMAEFQGRIGDLQEAIGGPFRDVIQAVTATVLSPFVVRLTDAAEDTDRLNDAVIDFGLTIADVGDTLVSLSLKLQSFAGFAERWNLTPTLSLLTPATKVLQDLRINAKQLEYVLEKFGYDGFADFLADASDADELNTVFDDLRDRLTKLREEGTPEIEKPGFADIEAPDIEAPGFADIEAPEIEAPGAEGFEEALSAIDRLNKSLGNLGVTEVVDLTARSQELGDAMRLATEAMSTGILTPEQFDDVAEALGNINDEVLALGGPGGFASVTTQVSELQQAIDQLGQGFRFSTLEFAQAIAQQTGNLTNLATDTYQQLTAGVSDAIGDIVLRHEDASEAIKATLESIGQTILDFLVQQAAAAIAGALLTKTIASQQQALRMAQLAQQTYAGAFAATVVIPVVGPALAPGVAKLSTAAMLGGSAAAAAAGASVGKVSGFFVGGVADGPEGRDVIPARLTRGETILDTYPAEGRAILSGRAAVVPTGARGRFGAEASPRQQTVQITINALDAPSVRNLFVSRRREIMEALAIFEDEGDSF